MEITDAALEALSGMRKADRRFVLDGIRTHLLDNDPVEGTRNKFILRRPSAHAERELRLGEWRVFYTVTQKAGRATVNLIGEKRNNKLYIGGKEFEL